MKKFIDKIKSRIKQTEEEDEYVELKSNDVPDEQIVVRPFILEDFSDLKQILDYLREGNTIAFINIKPMREKDILELKRAVAKVKNTVDAINGDIRGFGEDHIIIVPSYVKITKYLSKEQETSEPYFE